MVMPCFLSKPFPAAMTTEAQSVSGMKPIFTSAFSGASDPAAQTVLRIAGDMPATRAAVPSADCERKRRRDANAAPAKSFLASFDRCLAIALSPFLSRHCRAQKTKGVTAARRSRARDAFVYTPAVVGGRTAPYQQGLCQ